jgi:hypothetical protein
MSTLANAIFRCATATMIALTASALLFATQAQAAFISYSASIPLSDTDWDSSVTINKFNPGLGTLTGIQLTLTGSLLGDVQVENKSRTTARFIDSQLGVTITLMRPDFSTLVVTAPMTSFHDFLAAYDGTTDFGGASGKTHSGITASVTNSFASPPPASDLALFTGSGTITLPVSAVTDSLVSGANLAAIIDTSASATVDVQYQFTLNPPSVRVPEPASLVLLGSGLMAAGAAGRRRKRAAKAAG